MTFQDDLNRMLAEAYDGMMDQARTGEGLTAESLRRAYDQLGESPYRPTITVHQHTAYVPASLELLVDVGAMTEDEARARGWTPPPPPSRRARLRWRWQAWRERAGRKIGSWIAGVDLSEDDRD